MKIKLQWWVWGLILLACAAYFLPWIWNPAAALAPNAHDLAEWTTLHPAARQMTPPLLPSFFLRANLGILAVLIILKTTSTNSKWIGRLLALGLIILMLPPADFLISARDDINYQQQFYLSTFTFLLVLAASFGASKLPTLTQKALILLTIILGIIAGIWGLLLGLNIYVRLGIGSAVGVGCILFCSVLLVLGAEDLFSIVTQHKNRSR
ncbi:hypothetical protein ACFLYO_01850 [Chloroflexota bacterium]